MIRDILKKYRFTIISFIGCYVISFLLRCIGLEFSDKATIVFSFLNAIVILLILHLISRFRFKPLWISMLTFFIVFDTVYFILFKSTISIGIIESIVSTNATEAYEVSKGMLPLGIVAFAVFYVILYKASKELVLFKLRVRYSLLATVTITFLFPFVLTLRFNKETRSEYVENLKLNPTLLMSDIIGMKYPLVVGNILNVVGYCENIYTLSKAASIERSFPSDFKLSNTSITPEKIFLIVGESSTCKHYSLYNYALKTTPYLDSISVYKDQMQFFENVISPASYTLKALKQTLTLATPQNSKPFFNEMNIIELAKQSGYKTYWISNQEKVGLLNNIASIIAANADEQYFETREEKEDLNLSKLVRQRIIPNQKQLFIIHLRGSHIDYNTRFDTIDTQQLGTEGEYIKYDKSIHHTDRVLKDFHKLILESKLKSLIYYYSDHGEVVNIGHAILNGELIQYQIPLITMTNEFQVDSIVKTYYDTETNRLNSSSTSYILSEVMGYTISPERKKQVIKDGRYVRQSDNKTYLYDDLAKKIK